MILPFSEIKFVKRWLKGFKQHTLREDKNDRWKAGMEIHAWYLNPRFTSLQLDKKEPTKYGYYLYRKDENSEVELIYFSKDIDSMVESFQQWIGHELIFTETYFGEKVYKFPIENGLSKPIPFEFDKTEVRYTGSVRIDFIKDIVHINHDSHLYGSYEQIKSAEKLKQFAINDGFDSWDELKEWFGKDEFVGKIIYPVTERSVNIDVQGHHYKEIVREKIIDRVNKLRDECDKVIKWHDETKGE